MNRDLSIVFDIYHACYDSIEFSTGLTKAQFIKNNLVHSAVIQKLMIIGEATKRLSTDFRKENAEVPWKLMAGMRDKIIHEYFDVDLHQVWRTAKEDIPILLLQLKPLVPQKRKKTK